MSVGHFIKLLLAFAYILFPMGVLLHCALRRTTHHLGRLEYLCLLASLAIPPVCLLAATTTVSLNVWLTAHPWFVIVSLPLLALAFRRSATALPPRPRDSILLLILLTSLLLRFLPLVVHPGVLGEGDARFHNLLTALITTYGQCPPTWAPFADIPVAYPTGMHFLAALIASIARTPPHEANQFLLSLAPTLTAGVLAGIARQAFPSPAASSLTAAAYGFLAVAGSLAYPLWGGVTNAIGMLSLTAAARLMLIPADAPARSRATLSAAIALAGIPAIHHYSALMAGLLLPAFLLACSSSRRSSLAAFLISGMLAAPLLVTYALRSAGTFGATSAFTFREPFIPIWQAALDLGPLFIFPALVALWAARRSPHTPPQTAMLAWLVLMLLAFVTLEYAYRLVTLILTRGHDWYTALTPSRLIANAAYPLSILIGGITLSPLWSTRRSLILSLFTGLCLVSAATALSLTWSCGLYPDIADAGRWIRANTPPNALIEADLPHLEYIAWRRTTHPPLPASEARNAPRPPTSSTTPRFRILSTGASPVPELAPVYSNATLTVWPSRTGVPP